MWRRADPRPLHESATERRRGIHPAARSLVVAASAALLLLAGPIAAGESEAKPRLILQITVDQLRGDLLWRHYDQFGKDGFRRLLDRGTVFLDAHHAHANTETIVGHVTLATGAHPAVHGMVGNLWFDRTTGERTYNIEDARYKLLVAGAGVDAETEIDPTQKAARVEGRSPAAILVSTFGDELALATGGRAKVFGVSVKDRGAVAMAGHAGKAFWFSKSRAEFVTSSYYYERYPEWVEAFNKARPAERWSGQRWELLSEREGYLFGDRDDQPWEAELAAFKRTFPHPYGPSNGPWYPTLLTVSPAGDELTLAFAEAVLRHESLGADAVPDYLAVSFSSTDYVGHLFGPSSLESEDNLLRLDRVVARLLAVVDEAVGLERTLIVLSADHGTPEAPGTWRAQGIEADYVNPAEWDRAPAIARLKERFGIGDELISAYVHPYLFLDREKIAAKKLDLADVQRAVARELEILPGVAAAVATADLRAGGLPDTDLYRSILNNDHPDRSGDLFVVFEPHHFINEFDGLQVAATHGSPWRYDTFVPLVFAGWRVPQGRVARRVFTIDVTPTLAILAGTCIPSGAAGKPLPEVCGGR